MQEALKAWARRWWWLIIVAVVDVALHYAFTQPVYGRILLWSQDSADYFDRAIGGPFASHTHTPIWPLVMRSILWVDHHRDALFLASALFGTGTHLTFLGTLVVVARCRVLSAVLISVPLFYNPFWFRLGSMALMSDTSAILLVALGTFLVLRQCTFPAGRPAAFAVAAFLGCMTFYKQALFLVGISLVVVLLAKLRVPRRFGAKVLLVASFLVPPIIYRVAYTHPMLGTYSQEAFSGRAIFANLQPHIECSELIDAVNTEAQRDAATIVCQDDDTADAGAWVHLWSEKSRLWRITSMLAFPPLKSNAMLRSWAIQLILNRPSIAFDALMYNVREAVGPIAFVWLWYQQPPLINGCEPTIRELFSLDVDTYVQKWRLSVEHHRQLFRWLDEIGNTWYRWLRYLELTWVLLQLPLVVVATLRGRDLTLSRTVATLAFVYLVATNLAHYYEMRTFMVFDYWASLSFGLAVLSSGQANRDRVTRVFHLFRRRDSAPRPA